MVKMDNVTCWEPVGKLPSGLWAGETSNFNDVFMALYRYFETHSEYSFEYLGSSNYNDEIQKSYSSMQLTRISKWLAYFGLVQHHAERVAHTGPHDENKKVLMHTVEPTQKGYQVIEEGGIFDVGQSHSGSHKVGVGKAYPSFAKSHKWLGDAYLSVKVAQWRQSKWWGEFNRFYYDNVDKTADKMQSQLSKWLSEKLATIPARHNRLIKAAAPLEVALSKSIVDFMQTPLTKFAGEVSQPRNFGD